MVVIMARPRRHKLPRLEIDGKTIGKRLASLRKQRGLSQVDLAGRIGIIQVLVSDYELGKLRLHGEMLIRFARALNVTTDEILGLQGDGKVEDGKLSLKILRRMKRIESLPPSRQKTVLRALDLMLEGADQGGEAT